MAVGGVIKTCGCQERTDIKGVCGGRKKDDISGMRYAITESKEAAAETREGGREAEQHIIQGVDWSRKESLKREMERRIK